jgi:cellulose synthase/poly-beta-1,6-N-acetylglucosamine synthase-like glycosyltransferase
MIFLSMDIIYYIFLFIALYFQIFFLLSYLENFDFFNIKKEDKKIAISSNSLCIPQVSIIVACWNEESTLDATVESIFASDYPRTAIEVILVDDGSTDTTWQKMQRYKDDPQITLLHKKNGGKFTAINYALEVATGSLIATVDADTKLEPTALGFMVDRFLQDESLDALGSTIVLTEPQTLTQIAQSVEYQMFAFTKLILAKMHGALVVPGAFSMYRKKVFKTIGFFKEAHKLEDLELTFRMQEAHMKVGQSRDAIAYTNAPDTIVSLFKQRLRWGYGFIKNSYDYRHLIYNKEQGDFGAFTLPMSLFSYVAIVITFMFSWFVVFQAIIRSLIQASLIGWNTLFEWNGFDIANLSAQASVFITLILYASVIFMIFSGKQLVNDRSKNPFALIVFFILYSIIVPFWVLKSIYNSIIGQKVAWR